LTTRRFALALAVCLALAAGLRLLGITHGWPRNYLADTTVVRAALSIGAGANPFAGESLPTQYPYALPYLLVVIYGGFFALGWLAGAFASVHAFEAYAFANPEVFFLTASAVVAAFGCAEVWVVAAVARRLLGERAAVLAALFTATSLILVQLSHQPRPHVVAATLILLALACTLRYLDAPAHRGWLTLAWLSAGLATSTSPYGVLSIAIPLAGSIRRRAIPSSLRGNLPGIAVFLVAQVFFYPRLVVGDPVEYDAATGLFRSYGGLYLDGRFINGAGFPKLLGWLCLYEPVLSVIAALALAIALVRRRWHPRWAVTAIFPLLYLLVYGSYEVIHPRYLVPLIGFLAIPAGGLAARWQEWVAQQVSAPWGPRWRTPAVVAVGLAVVVVPAVQALRFDVLLRRDDTRTIAERWIRDNLRDSRLIAAEAHGVELPLDARSVRWAAMHHPDQLGVKDRHRLRAAAHAPLDDGFPVRRLWYAPGYQHSAIGQLEHQSDIGHVVAVVPGDRARVDPFYRSLQEQGRLLTRVTPLRPDVRVAETGLPVELQRPLWELWKVDRCGPIIEIYELRHE